MLSYLVGPNQGKTINVNESQTQQRHAAKFHLRNRGRIQMSVHVALQIWVVKSTLGAVSQDDY